MHLLLVDAPVQDDHEQAGDEADDGGGEQAPVVLCDEVGDGAEHVRCNRLLAAKGMRQTCCFGVNLTLAKS
jgi:hypothetical protein